MKEIVIQLSEEDYKVFQRQRVGISTPRDRLFNAVKEGTVLPEHYGRLIDAKAYEQDIRKHYFDNELVIRSTEIALSNAPTIIEADTVESEKI